MSKVAQTILRNIVYIIILQMVCFPFGVFIWLFTGRWHLFHVLLGFGYVYAVILIIETANLLIKHVRLVDVKEENTPQNDTK